MLRLAQLGSPVVVMALLAAGLSGCSTDDATEVVARGPEDLAIVEVSTLGSSVTESGGTLQVGCSNEFLARIGPADEDDDDVVELGDFALAPPGGCGTLTDCGWIVLGVASEDEDVDVELINVQAIRTPVVFQLPAEKRSGKLLLRVELRDVWGKPVTTAEGKRLVHDFSVVLESADCVAPSVDETADP